MTKPSPPLQRPIDAEEQSATVRANPATRSYPGERATRAKIGTSGAEAAKPAIPGHARQQGKPPTAGEAARVLPGGNGRVGPFVAARPGSAGSGSSSSPERASTRQRSDLAPSQQEGRRPVPGCNPRSAQRTLSRVDEKRGEQSTDRKVYDGGVRSETRITLSETADGGRDGGLWSGIRTRDDLAPKVLLARERDAARRREERAAAARQEEEEQLRLSSSFRATEVRRVSRRAFVLSSFWCGSSR